MDHRKRNTFCHYGVIVRVIVAHLLAGARAIAQDVSFRYLTMDDGLSQNAVYSILKDSQGFMWFGISVQFVREQCVRGMSAKTYNPEEERGAGDRLGLSLTIEII
ncbi:hypothetical protein DYD21_02060 [Rhodohalobacter sp. SW132]|uniref:two-component regulator propeller domain-containing protein n=1 Tax=Rhodohalobacter sp. SW132 TaxID=2293433 RepID=UPI000E24C146|nr:two-component regulator propeller domain-containing protein [Rhodohalobacter sp. SW132]REL38758.1 hypothetical protein DYD21_02060 [Rhodohalobacter sp. SW132]